MESPWAEEGRAELMAEDQMLETLESAEYWEQVCPHLRVGRWQGAEERGAETAGMDRERAEFVENGFFHLERQHLFGDSSDDDTYVDDLVDKLARGVILLLRHGWPASFIFMYDEAWQIIERASGSLKAASGGSEFVGDVYAWYVDPRRGQRGWGPHRDRQGSGPETFRADGTAKLSTTWLALTNASPLNSCLYVVPRGDDPYYDVQDRPDVDPLKAIFEDNPGAYQSIRALPCRRGSAWHFSHKIIHWGSFVKSDRVVEPRIAMSWVVGDSSFEQPAFHRDFLPAPPVAVRAAFVAAQQIAYGGQTGLKKGFKNMCFRLFKRRKEHFTEFYVDKVTYIFYCRPPPPKSVQLKERTARKDPVDVDRLEFATEEDNAKLDGIGGLFPCSDSSSSESEQDE